MTDLRCIGKACNDGPPLDGEPAARLTHLPALLCTRCADGLTRRLAELPARRDLLRDVLGGIAGVRSSENKPTKGNPPVPLNIDAHDALVNMQAVTVTWVQLVCEERGLRGPDDSDLRRLAPWLVSQVEWITEQPWVDDLAEEMRDIARVADGLTAHKARWSRLEAPCPDCGALELGRWDGADEVSCRSCGLAWLLRYYDDIVKRAALMHTVTATQAAERLGVEPATFRQWVSRGRIAAVGRVDGHQRYEVGTVDALVEEVAS